MNLTDLFNVPPKYVEFAWICAPNTQYQQVNANVITTLFMNTMLGDTVTVAPNTPGTGIVGASITPGTIPALGGQATTFFTLPKGIYAYEAKVPYGNNYSGGCVLALYNRSNNTYVSRTGNGGNSYGTDVLLNGQLNISTSTNFDLRFLVGSVSYVFNGRYDAVALTVTTPADADQRTTIKFWKLQ